MSSSDNSPAGEDGRDRESPVSRSVYYASLELNATKFPLMMDALMRTDRHRPRRMRQFVDGLDALAIESTLRFLRLASEAFNTSGAYHDLAFLPARIADDIRMALEGLLSGYLQVPSDAMRDVIEAELLVRDFTIDSSRVDIWRSADPPYRDFWPQRLRVRQARALGITVEQVKGTDDYRAHSGLLHVRPSLLFDRSPWSGHRALTVLETLLDIMFHAVSSAEAIHSLGVVLGCPASGFDETIGALDTANEDLHRAWAAVDAMERQAKNALNASGGGQVTIFENGLVIFIDPSSDQPSFYETSQTDFRRFHRRVLQEGEAAFDLESLSDDDKIDQESDSRTRQHVGPTKFG